jgi:hypothetical protein
METLMELGNDRTPCIRAIVLSVNRFVFFFGHLRMARPHPEVPLAHKYRYTSADIRSRTRRKPYSRPPATDFPVLLSTLL